MRNLGQRLGMKIKHTNIMPSLEVINMEKIFELCYNNSIFKRFFKKFLKMAKNRVSLISFVELIKVVGIVGLVVGVSFCLGLEGVGDAVFWCCWDCLMFFVGIC